MGFYNLKYVYYLFTSCLACLFTILIDLYGFCYNLQTWSIDAVHELQVDGLFESKKIIWEETLLILTKQTIRNNYLSLQINWFYKLMGNLNSWTYLLKLKVWNVKFLHISTYNTVDHFHHLNSL